MLLKRLFRILLGVQFALGIGLGILTISLFANQEELSKSRRVHFQSYLLADELRQSSDDLTRLARTYVATGNEEFERQYWAVLDIRNGKSPRPVDYNRIYWDFFTETGWKPRPDGATISLRELMIREGFTDAELEKLSLSQKQSDELVRTEKIAMNAVKGLFDDGSGNFAVHKEPDRAWAITLMNDEAYHKNKSGIMRPIDEFFAMFAERTAGDVAKYEQRSITLLQSLVALIIVIMGMFGYSFVIIQRQVSRQQQAEERLKDERNLLSTLIHAIPDEIAVKDLERRFVLVNPSCVRALGKDSADKVLGKRDEDLMPKEFAEVNMLEEYQVLSTGKPILNAEGKSRLDPITGEIKRALLMSRSPILDEHGTVTGLVVVNRDITERKRAEVALFESETLFRTMFSEAPIGIALIDSHTGHIYEVNPMFAEIAGRTMEEMIQIDWMSITHPDDVQEDIDNMALMNAGKTSGFQMEKRYLHRDGTSVWILMTIAPIVARERAHPRHLCMIQDITERKHVEDVLRESEQQLSTIYETVGDVLFQLTIEPEGIYRFRSINREFCKATGLSQEQVVGKTVNEVIPEPSLTTVLENYQQAIIEKKAIRWEESSEYPSGRVTGAVSVTPVVDVRGNCTHLVGSVHDITALKQSHEMIRKLLQEKELLLHEVHHRIKNNMNTMMSLLSLQASAMKDPGSIEALKDARRRIQSMMVLYDKLYRTEGFRELSTKGYLVSLVHEVIDSFPNAGMVETEMHIEDFILDAKRLSPLGIVINELITNTMKYAFVGRDKGLISLTASLKGNCATIVVGDDGIGVPEGFDLKTSAGFGLRLVDMLTQQIGGTLRIEREKGTRFILDFEV